MFKTLLSCAILWLEVFWFFIMALFFLLLISPVFADIQKNHIVNQTVTTVDGYDIKRLFTTPEALNTALEVIDTRYKDLKMAGYIAYTFHGFALATALASMKSVKAIYMDSTYKMDCAPKENFVIITDILESPKDIKRIIASVKAKGGNVVEVSCVTELSEHNARGDIEVPVASIFVNAPKK